jgi:cell division protein FtsL
MAEVRAFRRRSSLDKTFFSVGFLIPVVLVLCMALVYVRVKVETIKLGYDISANKKQEEEALRENFALQAKFMELKSPPRIEYLASGLGFKFPTQEDVIYLKENTIVGERK